MYMEPVAAEQSDPVRDDGAEPIVLSVIIPTYNAREVVRNCLESLYRNPPSEAFEVIVVDDASTDGTSAMVSVHFPSVCLLRNEVNLNYSASNNRAIAMARGQYIQLMNNDTIVLPAAFDRMVEFLRQHPDAGVVGSKLLNADGTVQWSVRALPDAGAAFFGGRSIITRLWPNNRFSRKYLLHLDRDPSQPFQAGYVSSASMMMPRHVVAVVGELDSRLLYHTDSDYCKRIADAGYKCYYLPSATIVHLEHQGGTMVTLRRRLRSLTEFHVGGYIYYRKHGRQSFWNPMHAVVIGGLAARFVLAVSARLALELGYLKKFAAQPELSSLSASTLPVRSAGNDRHGTTGC